MREWRVVATWLTPRITRSRGAGGGLRRHRHRPCRHFGTVKVGIPTRHRLVFVPLDRDRGPRVPQGRLRREQVKDTPSIGTDGELPAAEEEAVSSTTA